MSPLHTVYFSLVRGLIAAFIAWEWISNVNTVILNAFFSSRGKGRCLVSVGAGMLCFCCSKKIAIDFTTLKKKPLNFIFIKRSGRVQELTELQPQI